MKPLHPLTVVLILILGGCASPPEFSILPTIKANPNKSAPQAAVLRFATDVPVDTTVEISDGERTWNIEFNQSRIPGKGLPIVGLRPGCKHEFRIRVRDAAGEETVAPETLELTTPPLPDDPERFPPIDVTLNKADELEEGFILFNPRRRRRNQPRFGAGFGMLLAVDYSGDVRWYYQTDSRISDFELFSNGHIVYVTQDYRVVEIDWLGNVINQWYASGRPQGPAEGAIPVGTTSFHHEVDELPNGNIVALGSEVREINDYYTSEYNKNAPRKRQPVMGDVIVEFDRTTGRVAWEWKAFDHMDPFRIGYETFSGYWDRRGFPGVVDWSHANNLVYDDSDDSLVINFRYQAAAMKIDRATKEIKWILGEPSGWGDLSDKLLKPAGELRWPYHQHSPSPTPNGTVLIFDNGNYRTRPFTPPLPAKETYTRAVEYKINEAERTIEEVWSSEGPGPESVVSFAMGDVDWLPTTGNVLVAYGLVMRREDVASGKFNWTPPLALHSWTRLRQYKHTTPAELLWEMVLDDKSPEDPIGWSLFGAEHLPYFGDRLRNP